MAILAEELGAGSVTKEKANLTVQVYMSEGLGDASDLALRGF